MQYGYFDNEKREYVIDNVALPCSWTNYLGVEDMAAVINHTAGGYLFYKTPEYHRISRFRGNRVPMERPGFYVYIRDNEKKDYHSISWQPVAKDLSKAKYRCRHGLSYTAYESEYDGLASSQTMVIPAGKCTVVGCKGEKYHRCSQKSFLIYLHGIFVPSHYDRQPEFSDESVLCRFFL